MMTEHKTRSIIERYNIVSEGDLQAAAEKLDDFSKTIKDGAKIKTARNLRAAK